MLIDSLLHVVSSLSLRRPRTQSYTAIQANAGLHVEYLEERNLLDGDTPFIVTSGVLPVDGSIVANPQPTIQIEYSEAMVGSNATNSGAADPDNYLLFDADGNSITIDNVTLSAGNTIATLDYNGGNDLFNSNYSVFVRGTQLIDQDDGRALAEPGQIVVANAGQNNVAIIDVPGNGSLGALSNYPIPPIANVNANPVAVTFAELSGDTISDLILVNTGNDSVAIYAGRAGGGFALSPTTELDLPSNINPGLAKAITTADFNADGLMDLAIVNENTDEVSLFLNSRTTVGQIQFATRADINVDDAPIDVVSGDFDGDDNLDLAVLHKTAPNNLGGSSNADFRLTILRGDGAGAFAAPDVIRIGDSVNGLRNPTGIATGQLGGDSKLDLAISGGNGLLTLVTNSVIGTPNFIQTVVPTFATTSVAVGDTDNDGNVDLVATSNATGGQVLVLRNIGGVFLAPTRIGTGANPRDVQLHDLNGDNLLDIAYVNQQDPGQFGLLLNTGVTVNGRPTRPRPVWPAPEHLGDRQWLDHRRQQC